MGWNPASKKVEPLLTDFVPGRSGMKHLNRCISRFFGGLDLLGVLVTVAISRVRALSPMCL